MIKTRVLQDGMISLGEQAVSRGFRPGTIVNVLVTLAGSVIISIDEDPPPINVPFKPLIGGQAQLALKRARRGR